jgi:hypothetical protein
MREPLEKHQIGCSGTKVMENIGVDLREITF